MRSLYTLTLVAMFCSPAIAQKADDHLRMCLTGDMCESSRSQFKVEYPKAHRGDYGSQRNVSYCLVTGCDGAVQVNRPLGCAWRIVIVASGSPRVDSTDTGFFAANCRGKLSEIEAVQMATQADALFRRIYKRPLPAGL